MKRIRFKYNAGYVGTGGYEDILVEDDITENKLCQLAEEVMQSNLPDQESSYEEIADDDDSWEGE